MSKSYPILMIVLLLVSSEVFARQDRQKTVQTGVEMEPDTLCFLDSQDVLEKDVAITNMSEDTVSIDSLNVTRHYFLYYYYLHDSTRQYDLPQTLIPRQTLFIQVAPALPVGPISEDQDYIIDTLYVYTDTETHHVILVLDPSISSVFFEKFRSPESFDRFCLEQNYPNPFNPQTTLSYSVPFPDLVTLRVYDSTGREIRTLVHAFQEANTYFIDFDAGNWVGGIYFYRLTIGNRVAETRKMVLIR